MTLSLRREFFNVSRPDEFRIVPIGDIHIGAAACDEGRLRQVVKSIHDDDNAYWVGMGDYCDFINRTDPRFNSGALADWIKIADLGDLAKAQRDHFFDIIKPIAAKCLALVEGNHETAITRHYERAIFSEIVTGVKTMGGHEVDYQLGVGYTGWLLLVFHRGKKRSHTTTIKINLHHGFVGGKLAGAKALNMQRWLWTHEADVVVFGHSHNTASQVEAVEALDDGGNVKHKSRIGIYSGTFLNSYNEGAATYAEIKGYFPNPNTGVELILRPGAADQRQRVKVMSG